MHDILSFAGSVQGVLTHTLVCMQYTRSAAQPPSARGVRAHMQNAASALDRYIAARAQRLTALALAGRRFPAALAPLNHSRRS
jgi:hypothetical protein